MNQPIAGMLISGPEGEETLRLEELVGAGAFGDVWKAVEVSSGVGFAVKFPRLLAMGSGDELTAFRNEVEAAREIRHPNVVPVVHVGAAPIDAPPYLVMEFVEGGTLRARLQQYAGAKALVPPELVQIWAEGLVDGIAAINERMLHRDLRPENMLMKGDRPLIGDFGLSKVVGAITRSKTFKGAQHVFYMPPEGWRLESNDIQIDMYAMGVVLFEIATLQYPYESPPDVRDIGGLRDMHLFQQARSVRDLRSDLPVGFSHVVSRLMEKRPEDRFSTWSNARDALVGAWTTDEMSHGSSSGLLGALLEETERLHDLATRESLEAERRIEVERERRQIDELQMGSLLGSIREAIRGFNERSPLGRIRDQGSLPVHRFDLPFGGVMSLRFFWVDPPLDLKVGHVRFVGHLADPAGAGLNYLLCRMQESDIYGKWVACLVRVSPAVDRRKMTKGPEPFGLPREEMHEIQVADEAMHVYQVEFSEDVAGSFLRAALESMQRRRSS